MPTKFVRIEYIDNPDQQDKGKEKFYIRFIKNLKYCDFIV